MNLDRHDEAAARFEAYLARWGRKPLAVDARIGLGAAHEARGRWAEAEAVYREVVEKDPDHPRAAEARMGRARALEALGRRDEAAEAYRAVAGDTATFFAEIARSRLRVLAP